MNLSFRSCTLGFAFFSLTARSLALNVFTTSDANAMLAAALGPVPGVTVNGATYNGSSFAAGTFDSMSFGPLSSLSSGVLLTTGDAQLAVGPNDSDSAGLDNGGPNATFLGYDGVNDIDLYNVATLSIDFEVASQTDLSFQFSFGSEEYWFYTNSQFNDSFLAFLDNNPKTLALDAAGKAITINNQFLTIDNRPNYFDPTNGYGLPDKIGTGSASGITELQYDGFTPVLRTSFGVTAGAHTLTFVIGDAGDGVLDSGVFISHIFGAGKPSGDDGGPETEPVPEPNSALALGTLAIGIASWLKRRQ